MAAVGTGCGRCDGCLLHLLPLVDSARGSRASGFFLGRARPGAYDAAPQTTARHPWPAHSARRLRAAARTTCRRILTARVYDVAQETPLEHARALSRRLGNHVLLKREDQQTVFSFKLRGAYNKMVHLSAAQLARGVICASAGNHAQGVALARQAPGLPRRGGDAGDHAAREGRRRAGARRRGGAARRQLLRRLRARADAAAQAATELRAPVRRPRRDRRPGHRSAWRSCASTRGRSTRCSSPSAAAG